MFCFLRLYQRTAYRRFLPWSQNDLLDLGKNRIQKQRVARDVLAVGRECTYFKNWKILHTTIDLTHLHITVSTQFVIHFESKFLHFCSWSRLSFTHMYAHSPCTSELNTPQYCSAFDPDKQWTDQTTTSELKDDTDWVGLLRDGCHILQSIGSWHPHQSREIN